MGEGMDLVEDLADKTGVVELKMEELFVVRNGCDEVIGLELGWRQPGIGSGH